MQIIAFLTNFSNNTNSVIRLISEQKLNYEISNFAKHRIFKDVSAYNLENLNIFKI